MNVTSILSLIAAGFITGSLIVGLLFFFVRRQIIKDAQEESRELLKEAQELFEEQENERKEKTQEIELEAWSQVEETHLAIEEKCEDLESKIQQTKTKHEEKVKNARALLLQKENELRDKSFKIKEFESKIEAKKSQQKATQAQYKELLLNKTQLDEKECLIEITQSLIHSAQADYAKFVESEEIETKEFAEQKAKRLLALSIDRFQKEMSTERGIAASYFPTPEIKKLFMPLKTAYVELIQKMSGCDIHIEESDEADRWDHIQVIGFDPVRRELTRRLFDRLFRDIEKTNRAPKPEDFQKTCENIRNELLNQIKRDGDLICKELGLQNVHAEIRQVMGSLRYRYSYTQNQYFHCAEVGWFAGLLGSELGGQKTKTSRRSGMLHDLGKALDHEIDGGHAVIGADFIEPRGEATEIVHAVRAHHYDVQPENDLDFLVIAADAISGGRPGARRSTVETYNQKVTGLQEISRRHKGVTDVFVLNGGRECRVLVNSKMVDDSAALKMAEQIAKTIEDEMQYPGQIKVVVVRETVVTESTVGKTKDHHR